MAMLAKPRAASASATASTKRRSVMMPWPKMTTGIGRVAKAGPETGGFSIDAVHMTGPGPLHRHPMGEIDWCVPLEGAPTFDGRGAGWVVLGPGSTHVPTVAGGAMLVVYLLPQGAIEFL